MAKIVILGAGIAGQAAVTLLRKKLPRKHEIVMISPNEEWNWVPSNIWVGVGIMGAEQVCFPLAPLYERIGVEFRVGAATAIHPEGDASSSRPFVEYVPAGTGGETRRESFDFLVNATGPKLNFGATPGLGPGEGGHSWSVCTAEHAVEASAAFLEAVERMKRGEEQTFVVGMGHGSCTCEGAAFEYVLNVEHELKRHGVREKGRIVFVTNEPELGDFGVGGLFLRHEGYVTPSHFFAESLFTERGIEWVKGANVMEVGPGRLAWESPDGSEEELTHDFAMLLPPFAGVGLQAYDRNGEDLTDRLFAPSGFQRVDADYGAKAFGEWSPRDWPETYQSPHDPRLFAVGIAFAPPHPVSRPIRTPRGHTYGPTVPRTGMTAAVMGATVAESIADLVRKGPEAPLHRNPFATMAVACVASAGAGFRLGSAATITMYPLVPDYERYEYGRDLESTTGEIGLAGHWLKYLLHYLFLYKARCRPGWSLIPE
mgnify:FL=1